MKMSPAEVAHYTSKLIKTSLYNDVNKSRVQKSTDKNRLEADVQKNEYLGYGQKAGEWGGLRCACLPLRQGRLRVGK